MELDPQEGENVAETSRKEDEGKSGDIIEYAMEPTKLGSCTPLKMKVLVS